MDLFETVLNLVREADGGGRGHTGTKMIREGLQAFESKIRVRVSVGVRVRVRVERPSRRLLSSLVRLPISTAILASKSMPSTSLSALYSTMFPATPFLALEISESIPTDIPRWYPEDHGVWLLSPSKSSLRRPMALCALVEPRRVVLSGR